MVSGRYSDSSKVLVFESSTVALGSRCWHVPDSKGPLVLSMFELNADQQGEERREQRFTRNMTKMRG